MHDKERITPASSLIIKVLSNLTVQCEECQQFVKASQLEEHLGSSCQSSTIAVSPTNVSVQDLLSKPSSSPLSPVEQQLGRNLVERMESDGILQVQTRGQVDVHVLYVYIDKQLGKCACAVNSLIACGVYAVDTSTKIQHRSKSTHSSEANSCPQAG